jgi:plastocyanin
VRRAVRMTAVGAGLALGGLAAVAGAASAAEVVVQGQDTLAWDKPVVDVAIGDTVRWTFAGTAQVHNVKSNSPNWDARSTLALPAPDYSKTFDTAGEYAFVCEVHPQMTGTVRVAAVNAPPPPPIVVPLSQQPLANDVPAAPAPETNVTVDKTAPGLTAVKAKAVRRGARITFRVSEDAGVGVTVSRGGKRLKTYAVDALTGPKAQYFTVRGLKAGKYVIRVAAADIAGNTSKVRKVTVTVK